MKRAALIFLLVVLPSRVAGQADRDAVHMRNRCRQAVQVVRTEHPAPRTAWAYELIPRCGAEGGAALADAIRAHRTASDRFVLDRITQPTSEILDGRVFEAAYAVAADPGSTPEARIFSLRTLMYAAYPGAHSTYEEITMQAPTRGCFGGSPGFDFEVQYGAAMPVDAHRRAYELGIRVFKNLREPEIVRKAAICTWETNRRRLSGRG